MGANTNQTSFVHEPEEGEERYHKRNVDPNLQSM